MSALIAGSPDAWSGTLAWFQGLPGWVVYVVLGFGAGAENIVPAVPADTFVVLGGFLSAVGDVSAWWVFAATWVGNVGTALLTYELGRRRGSTFFRTGVGRHLLNPYQMERMAAFYGRWGTPAIFLTRFLPGLRAIVPVFAGVTLMPFRSVVLPLSLASAIWYGALVWGGGLAGRNLDLVFRILGSLDRWLLGVAVIGVGVFSVWWWRTRHRRGHG